MRGAVTATLAPDSSFVDSKMIQCNRWPGYTHTRHPMARKELLLHDHGSFRWIPVSEDLRRLT